MGRLPLRTLAKLTLALLLACAGSLLAQTPDVVMAPLSFPEEEKPTILLERPSDEPPDLVKTSQKQEELPPPSEMPSEFRLPVGTSSAMPSPLCSPADVLLGPILTPSPAAASMPNFSMPIADPPLPINLATALRLSDARPLVVAAAQARVRIAAAQWQHARVLWLPEFNVGSAYIQHGGGNQIINGDLIVRGTNAFYGGGSLLLRVATTEAIFEPLAARQELRAKEAGVQTARNNALLATAEAYFNVQQARGTYAAMADATAKARDLVRRVQSLAQGLAAPDEIDRAKTLQARLEQLTATALQNWRVASARLTRVLRLNPATVVVPQEPDHLQITLIAPAPVDNLIAIGLTNRPELASHQALVQATLTRLKQERMRPIMPSILITGNGTPDFLYQGSIFGTGGSGRLNQWAGRSDVGAQMVWKLDGMGFGYRARVRERQGQVDLSMVELFNVQDQVAEEVAQARADVDSAAYRVGQAETGLKDGLETYRGNLKGLGQTTRFGDVLVLVNRPQEVVAALTQLEQAYVNYFVTVADYNRAQFRLFYALGFPASVLACDTPPGNPEPVDTRRPGYLPPVKAPPPCVH